MLSYKKCHVTIESSGNRYSLCPYKDKSSNPKVSIQKCHGLRAKIVNCESSKVPKLSELNNAEQTNFQPIWFETFSMHASKYRAYRKYSFLCIRASLY